jgi:hypothetical protein
MGANLIIMEGEEADPRSYSQLNSYTRCAKAYELERILKVPSRPGLWQAGGTAVHKVIERWLRQQIGENE